MYAANFIFITLPVAYRFLQYSNCDAHTLSRLITQLLKISPPWPDWGGCCDPAKIVSIVILKFTSRYIPNSYKQQGKLIDVIDHVVIGTCHS